MEKKKVILVVASYEENAAQTCLETFIYVHLIDFTSWAKYKNVYCHVLALYRVNRLTQVELENKPIVPILPFSPEILKFLEHFPQIIFRHGTYLSLIAEVVYSERWFLQFFSFKVY